MSAFGGVYFNVYTLGSCFMQRIHIINPVTGDPIPGSERGYGFYSRETDYGLVSDYKSCSYYAEDEKAEIIDAWVNASKFFTWLSMFLGTVAFFIVFSTCMCAYSQSMFARWLMWAYLIASICMGLSFLVFGSEFCQENKCDVAQGSGYALTTFMFWLSSANTIKSFGGAAPEGPSRDNGERRPWFKRKKDPNQIITDEQQDLADLYYEGEHDKYPIPEVTQDGRKRYSYFAALADDRDGRIRREDDSDSDDDDDDDSEGEEGRERQQMVQPQSGYYDQQGYGQPGYYDQGYYDEQGNYVRNYDANNQQQGYNPNYYYSQGNGQPTFDSNDYEHGRDDPSSNRTNLDAPAAQEGTGYEDLQGKRPQVGDPDGPFIT
ncbi:hypothetical protein FisN_13Hh133 [Fistulifera solaris]|uniref:Uncharacterized protein n=1 Tax=Fistulifera solaris TaxID=1519565 RepID=A0A1Z5KN72_FISSO|nr:hypothetical protein FisN_13Hh133 [Fistulifera solaris]|eukprot:GAX27764.1 hypothetical protein FisN_13Hh133 [Fistulifera solaris]